MERETTGDIDLSRAVVGPFQVNTYFLRRPGASEVLIIDPGEEGERLARLIESNGWTPRGIVNTHAHLDHIGAVHFLKERFTVPFHLHAAEKPVLARAPEAAALFGLPPPPLPEVDRCLTEGEILEIAGVPLRVLHTPGHTPGGVSLSGGGRLFVGDTLFLGSIGRTDLPGADHETLIRSIEERLMPFPDETIVHAGHGPDTTIGVEKETNPFLKGPHPGSV